MTEFAALFRALSPTQKGLVIIFVAVLVATTIYSTALVAGWWLKRARLRLVPPLRHETWCSQCCSYSIGTKSRCHVCGTTLVVFKNPHDFAKHVAMTYPLPPRRRDPLVYVDAATQDRRKTLRAIQPTKLH